MSSYAGVWKQPLLTPTKPQVGDHVVYVEDLGVVTEGAKGAYDHVYVGTGIPVRALLVVERVGVFGGLLVSCGGMLCKDIRKDSMYWPASAFRLHLMSYETKLEGGCSAAFSGRAWWEDVAEPEKGVPARESECWSWIERWERRAAEAVRKLSSSWSKF